MPIEVLWQNFQLPVAMQYSAAVCELHVVGASHSPVAEVVVTRLHISNVERESYVLVKPHCNWLTIIKGQGQWRERLLFRRGVVCRFNLPLLPELIHPTRQ